MSSFLRPIQPPRQFPNSQGKQVPYMVAGHNVYLVPNERNTKLRWTTKSSGSMAVDGDASTVGLPDMTVRMSRERNKSGFMRRSMLNQIVPERIVYEETMADLMREGHTADSAHDYALQKAQATWEKNQELPRRARGLHDDPTWMLRMMYGGFGGHQKMSTQPFHHPNAPDISNAQRAGQAPTIPVAPRVAPRNAVIGGLGTTAQNASQVRQDNRTRSMMTGRAISEVQERPGQDAVIRQYQSIDGGVYNIHVKNGDVAAPNSMRDLMLHCLFELAKGGNAATVLCACKFRFPDAAGQIAFDFEKVMALYAPTEPEEAASPDGISNEGADFG